MCMLEMALHVAWRTCTNVILERSLQRSPRHAAKGRTSVATLCRRLLAWADHRMIA